MAGASAPSFPAFLLRSSQFSHELYFCNNIVNREGSRVILFAALVLILAAGRLKGLVTTAVLLLALPAVELVQVLQVGVEEALSLVISH